MNQAPVLVNRMFAVYSTVTAVVKATEVLQCFLRGSSSSPKTSVYTVLVST